MYSFRKITEADVYTFHAWRYPPPYDIYNVEQSVTEEDIAYYLDPSFQFHAMLDDSVRILAFCSFGLDGQVPGGNYEAEALDIGMGVHPDLTNQGNGASYAAAVIQFAEQAFNPPALRVTIAEFNQRAQKVWLKNGFTETARFGRQKDGLPFIIMQKLPTQNEESKYDGH